SEHRRRCARDHRLQTQPAPKEQAMIRLPLPMLLTPGSDLVDVDAGNRLHWRLRRNDLKPFRKRDAEALLSPIDDVRWEQPRDSFLQEVFAGASPVFQLMRQSPTEVDEIIIEEDGARFERRHHRGTIDLCQNIIL